MESHGSSGPTDLAGLEIDVLRRAIDVYLEFAYAGAELPDPIQQRLHWPEGRSLAELLEGPPFERSSRNKPGASAIHALRLGNSRYPHMKLQIQPWPNEAGFLLSVNTHDQVSGLDPSAADLPAFRELQAENQRIKELIEQEWDRRGLPTFLSYLRDYIEKRGALPQEREET